MRKKLSWDSFPVRCPIGSAVTMGTILSYWKAPDWLWGAFGLIYLLWVAGWVASFWTDEFVKLKELQ